VLLLSSSRYARRPTGLNHTLAASGTIACVKILGWYREVAVGNKIALWGVLASFLGIVGPILLKDKPAPHQQMSASPGAIQVNGSANISQSVIARPAGLRQLEANYFPVEEHGQQLRVRCFLRNEGSRIERINRASFIVGYNRTFEGEHLYTTAPVAQGLVLNPGESRMIEAVLADTPADILRRLSNARHVEEATLPVGMMFDVMDGGSSINHITAFGDLTIGRDGSLQAMTHYKGGGSVLERAPTRTQPKLGSPPTG
jgi:hypothetical protein